MRDDELLAIYGATRQLAEGMTARYSSWRTTVIGFLVSGSFVATFPALARFQTWTVFALILALGFALGAFGTHFFFTRQVSTLNSRFDQLQQFLVAPPSAPADPHAPPPQGGKKHGQH